MQAHLVCIKNQLNFTAHGVSFMETQNREGEWRRERERDKEREAKKKWWRPPKWQNTKWQQKSYFHRRLAQNFALEHAAAAAKKEREGVKEKKRERATGRGLLQCGVGSNGVKSASWHAKLSWSNLNASQPGPNKRNYVFFINSEIPVGLSFSLSLSLFL